MTSAATPLRSAIKERLYPVITQGGFVRDKRTHPLFTGFRRQREGKVQVFDVQWDKYHRPCFVLNFGEAPLGDLELNGTRVPADEVGPAHCPVGGRVQRYRGGSLSCWFRLRRPWMGVLTSARWNFHPEEVADEVARAFQELEEWWASKVEGPHVYVWHSVVPAA
jgi:hypothetical protein